MTATLPHRWEKMPKKDPLKRPGKMCGYCQKNFEHQWVGRFGGLVSAGCRKRFATHVVRTKEDFDEFNSETKEGIFRFTGWLVSDVPPAAERRIRQRLCAG